MRIGPLHKELYSPERDEIERRSEYIELQIRRRERAALMVAIAGGTVIGAMVVFAIFAILHVVL